MLCCQRDVVAAALIMLEYTDAFDVIRKKEQFKAFIIEALDFASDRKI